MLKRLIHYRNSAEMVRKLVDDFPEEPLQKTLLEVATRYDKLADEMQRKINSATAVSKPTT
jgi:hypothetical protein